MPQFASRAFPAIIFASLLLFPIAHVAWDGSTLTGMYEESLGYRYFYTLRTLFDRAYVFLPQGELPDLLFKAVHLSLSASGHPRTELLPRIDLFAYAAVAVCHLVTLCCFIWATYPLQTAAGRLLAALFWGALYYLPGSSGQYAVLQPDYLPLIPAVGLLAAGCVIRSNGGTTWSWMKTLQFGALVGSALAVKPTLVIVAALPLFVAAITSHRVVFGLLCSVVSGALGVLIWVVLVFLDLSARRVGVPNHFVDLWNFIQSSPAQLPQSQSWQEWIWTRSHEVPLLMVPVYASPFLAPLLVVVARRRWEFASTIGIMLALATYSAFLYRRDYPITALECLFAVAAFITIASCFELPSHLSAAPRWVGVGILTVAVVASYPKTVGSVIASVAENTAEQQVLRKVQSPLPGKTLWLVERNEFRPLSIDSAIMKGGLGLSNKWLDDPPSLTMATMFPDRDFRFYVDRYRPVNLDDYASVLFVYDGTLAVHVGHLADVYQIPQLRTWNCLHAAAVGAMPIALCRRAAAQPAS